MADTAQIAKLLNQFRNTGMHDLAPDSDITSVIIDYFTKRTRAKVGEEGENFSEEDESALPTPCDWRI